jgi:CheY-like chemotaxis protein
VADTGVGIDLALLPRIFEPFFTTKEQGRGTGLGLATVYGIVQQSGGRIDVQSEPGRGTRFCISFPATNAALPQEIVEPSPPRLIGGSETILLVEDEADVRMIAREILETAGYTVLEASSGADAIDVLQSQRSRIRLILTDVSMPVMDGPTLAERIKGDGIDVSMLFMSGFADDALDKRCMTASDFPILIKPFSMQRLLTVVRQALDRQPAA